MSVKISEQLSELTDIINDWKYGAKIDSSLAKQILASGYRKTKQQTYQPAKKEGGRK